MSSVYAPCLREESTEHPPKRYAGGRKGINVSYILKMLDTESVVLGLTAGFTGQALEDAVKSMGIDCDFIRLDKGFTRICVKLFETDSSAET